LLLAIGAHHSFSAAYPSPVKVSHACRRRSGRVSVAFQHFGGAAVDRRTAIGRDL